MIASEGSTFLLSVLVSALIRSTWGRVSIVLASSNVVVEKCSFGDVLNLFMKQVLFPLRGVM